MKMNIDIKNLEKANPCWKCGKDPIIEISKQKTILKCPNEKCNNSIVLTDYPSIEDGFKVWNEAYNCKRIILKELFLKMFII